MFKNREHYENAYGEEAEEDAEKINTAESEDKKKHRCDFCDNINDIIGSKVDFADIGGTRDLAFLLDDELGHHHLTERLHDVQTVLFKKPEFIERKKANLKRLLSELERKRLKQQALEDEIRAREDKRKASAFQFDFGYLDAEVHDLLQQLESVFPDVSPMPNTSTTKSIYSTTKANVEHLGLKVILNRLCIIGTYTEVEDDDQSSNIKICSVSQSWSEPQNAFVAELKRIRCRTESVFAKELGEITGCFLSYPRYFILMFEGPELSIMDILHQSKDLFTNFVAEGRVFFVGSHVMVRYLRDWTDMMIPSSNANIKLSFEGNMDVAKEYLVNLSESCQQLWKLIASVKMSGMNPSNCITYDMIPDEKVIQLALDCGLLISLDVWLRRVTTLTYSNPTSETWPQIFYPSVATAYKNDTQFDSLGVLNPYEDMPGLDEILEEFLHSKTSWKSRDFPSQGMEDLSKSLKEKLLKQGSIVSVLSAVSKRTAYNYVNLQTS